MGWKIDFNQFFNTLGIEPFGDFAKLFEFGDKNINLETVAYIPRTTAKIFHKISQVMPPERGISTSPKIGKQGKNKPNMAVIIFKNSISFAQFLTIAIF